MAQEIIVERAVRWRVNGMPQRPFLCSPGYETELALGHLLAQGKLHAGDEARAVMKSGEVNVWLSESPRVSDQDAEALLEACAPVTARTVISRAELRGRCARLTGEGEAFGVHRALLFGPQGMVLREDAGRHNAVDKCAGYAFGRGWRLDACALGCTGRITLEMLAKAAALGVPVVFTLKYPSDLAVCWAERLQIAIVARAQKENAALYGAVWRITED